MTRAAKRKLHFTLGYAAAGWVGVLVAGLLSFGHELFGMPEPVLSLFILGLMAGLIYASAQMYAPWYPLPVIVLSLLARAALSPRSFSLLATVIDTLLVGSSLVCGAYLMKSLKQLRFGRFVCLGLLVGVGYTVMTVVFFILSEFKLEFAPIWAQTYLGAKLGAAMGLGFELVDLVGPRPEPKPDPFRGDKLW